MAYPDINDIRITNEIRTDAPLIDHGSKRNQTGGCSGDQKNLHIFLDKSKTDEIEKSQHDNHYCIAVLFMKPRYFVESLSKGLSVLSLLAGSSSSLSFTELYQRLGLGKSSIQRLTFTLQQTGYIDRDASSKRFRLGPKTIAIGFSVMRNLDLERLSYPHLQEASEEIGETVNLAVLDGKEIIYVGRKVSHQTLNVKVQIGSRRPLHSTSMGKVMLAFMPKDQLEEILETLELTAFTPRTITRRQDLIVELEKIRVRNFAISDEEMEIGVRSLAAPIRNATGEVFAAVNIAVPTTRISLRKLEDVLPEKVIMLADKISFMLGYVKQEIGCLPHNVDDAEEVIG